MLIKCEDCGHEMSDKAKACPNCGCPNPRMEEDENMYSTGDTGSPIDMKLFDEFVNYKPKSSYEVFLW